MSSLSVQAIMIDAKTTEKRLSAGSAATEPMTDPMNGGGMEEEGEEEAGEEDEEAED